MNKIKKYLGFSALRLWAIYWALIVMDALAIYFVCSWIEQTDPEIAQAILRTVPFFVLLCVHFVVIYKKSR